MSDQKSEAPLWEKIIGALGLLLLCCGIIYLIWTAATAKHKPVNISFEIEKVIELEDKFLVSTIVQNSGSQGAASLEIQGSLMKDGEFVEQHSMEIDYLPSNSSRKVGFFFKGNPANGNLSFQAISFQEP